MLLCFISSFVEVFSAQAQDSGIWQTIKAPSHRCLHNLVPFKRNGCSWSNWVCSWTRKELVKYESWYPCRILRMSCTWPVSMFLLSKTFWDRTDTPRVLKLYIHTLCLQRHVLLIFEPVPESKHQLWKSAMEEKLNATRHEAAEYYEFWRDCFQELSNIWAVC